MDQYVKALVYCRVSSEKQVTEGSGLDSQEHRCRTEAIALNLDVEKVFREEGISGSLFNRPAIRELLGYLDNHWQHKYVVIFDDLKRFARDVEVHRKLKAELRAREAKLHCLNYTFDDSAEGEFVETIFAAQNELERKQNRRQVCQKMKARLERGYWCFNPTTGYEYKKDKEHGKLLVPISPIADILAEGFTAFADNRLLSQTDFRQFLISKNFHTLLGKSEKQITFESIKRLLTQPLYAGLIDYPEWGITRRRAQHQAIIPEEVYDKIQIKLRRPERKLRETDAREFPLRRVVDCAFCHHKLTGSTSKGKRKYYSHYTCNNKECIANPKNIIASTVENDYVELLESIKVEPEVLEMAKLIVMRIWQQKVKDITSAQTAAEKEIETLDRQIDEYVNLMPTTHSEGLRRRYEVKISELEQRIVELKQSQENKKEPNFEEALNMTLKLLGTPAETWQHSEKEVKTMVHNMIFEENPKYCLTNGFGTPRLSPPFGLKSLYDAMKYGLVDAEGFEPPTSSV